MQTLNSVRQIDVVRSVFVSYQTLYSFANLSKRLNLQESRTRHEIFSIWKSTEIFF